MWGLGKLYRGKKKSLCRIIGEVGGGVYMVREIA